MAKASPKRSWHTQHQAKRDSRLARSPIPFDGKIIENIAVNRSATDRRVANLRGGRSLKNDWQTAFLLRAVTLIDLTTLSGDDTEERVRRLATKARHPVRQDILDDLGVENLGICTAAVCVYHEMVNASIEALEGSGIPTAAVSTGFPAGLSDFQLRLREISTSLAAGAKEIDVVISRRHVLTGQWQSLYNEVCEFRARCGHGAHLKTILATGELGNLRNVAKASWTCMMAGADFIKTSTGKETQNATLADALTMLRCIRDFNQLTGLKVGFKPAGAFQPQETPWRI